VDLLATRTRQQLVLWYFQEIIPKIFSLSRFPKIDNAKIMLPFAATKQMVGGVLLLVNLGLKLYSELKQTTVIKNKK